MSSINHWISKLPDQELFYDFVVRGFFSPLLAQILINKGFTDIHIAYSFLYPQLSDFSDPFIIPEMDLAVKRIFKALQKGEKILIYGDSDADGIIGTFILYNFLKSFTPNISWFLSNKNKDGYGFHSKHLSEFKHKKIDLIITVDVGISAHNTVNAAKTLGIDVIITDHHEIISKPDTITVSGKLTPVSSPVYHLCGTGVVFALIRALRTFLYHQGYFKDQNPPSLRKYLELVSLATLADMVPITGENRIITYFGFRDLCSPSFLSTQTLIESLNLNYNLSEEDLYFKIIPKINAAGRLGHPELAFKLLDAKDKETAQKYLSEIENLNLQRQALETEIIKNSLPYIEKELKSFPFLLITLKNIPKGLLGLIANRFKNLYNVPVIVISMENEIGVGSARSPENINFLKIFMHCKDLLIQYGGHKYAFGFQINKKVIPDLKNRLKSVLSSISLESEKKKEEYLYIDAETTLADLFNSENYYGLIQLHPYGEGHSPPLLLLKNFEIKNIKILKDKHSKLILKHGINELSAICFNKILENKQIKFIVGNPFINNFNNSLELKIKDVK